MAAESAIEWCDSTFNPWIGCTHVSPACDHCYAESLMDERLGRVEWGAGKPRLRTSASNWKQLVLWNARSFWQCGACGWRGESSTRATESHVATCSSCGSSWLEPARRRVFCASLADVFDNEAPVAWLADLLSLIAETPNLEWLLLSKRIGNWRARVTEAMNRGGGTMVGYEFARRWLAGKVPANVWIGATVVNQQEADRDVPKLLAVPARVRFVSVEPMLGPVELNGHEYTIAPGLGEGIDWLTGRTSQHSDIFGGSSWPWHERKDWEFPQDALEPRIHWVICGGETGPRARPVSLAWVRSLRDQCAEARVPFLFKQWGAFAPGPVVESSGFAGGAYLEAFGRTGIASPSVHVHGDGFGSLRMRGKESGKELDGRVHLEWPTPAVNDQGSTARG